MYEALSLATGKSVAVKQLAHGGTFHNEVWANQAQAAAGGHANVVAFHGCLQPCGQGQPPAMVFELARGGSLKDLLRWGLPSGQRHAPDPSLAVHHRCAAEPLVLGACSLAPSQQVGCAAA